MNDDRVLWVRLDQQVDAAFLDGYPNLKVICSPTTGLDHIDIGECQRRGIAVLSLKGDVEFLRTIPATSELTIALILGLLRRVPAAVQHVADGGWNRDQFRGRDLASCVVAIVGMGRVGYQVARLCQAFGANVIGNHALADVVSIHVPLDDTTRGMCDAAFFASMKSGACFVNTSRGEVVDEVALLDALESGHLAGAALDVVCNERKIRNERLMDFMRRQPDRLIITPHIGGNSEPSREKAELRIVEKLVAWANSSARTADTAPET